MAEMGEMACVVQVEHLERRGQLGQVVRRALTARLGLGVPEAGRDQRATLAAPVRDHLDQSVAPMMHHLQAW